MGEDVAGLGEVGPRLACGLRIRLPLLEERLGPAVLLRVARGLDRRVPVPVGLAECPHRGRLSRVRQGLLGSGGVRATLLRVSDLFRRTVDEGPDLLRLADLEGLEGSPGEEFLHLPEGALPGCLSGQFEVSARHHRVDPALAHLLNSCLRPRNLRLDLRPAAHDLNGSFRGPSKVEGAGAVPAKLAALRGLDQLLRGGHVEPLRGFGRLGSTSGVQGDPDLALPRPRGGGLEDVRPARKARVGAVPQGGLTHRARGHWKLSRDGVKRMRLASKEGQVV